MHAAICLAKSIFFVMSYLDFPSTFLDSITPQKFAEEEGIIWKREVSVRRGSLNYAGDLEGYVIRRAVVFSKTEKRLARIGWRVRNQSILQFCFCQLAPKSVSANQNNIRFFE